MNPPTEAELIDYLGGELPAARHAAVTAALARDPALQAELDELAALRNSVAATPEPTPSAAADGRFAALLAAAGQEAETDTRIRKLPRFGLYRYAAAAAAVLLIFAAGWYLGGAEDRALQEKLAASRTLMLELMQDQRPSARIRATTVSLDLPVADPATIHNLGYLLRNDESANVRLAALDALRRFSREPWAREELLAAMQESPPDVVRFELINVLVQLREQRVLPFLEELIEADSLPQPVRDAAQMASFKLI